MFSGGEGCLRGLFSKKGRVVIEIFSPVNELLFLKMINLSLQVKHWLNQLASELHERLTSEYKLVNLTY